MPDSPQPRGSRQIPSSDPYIRMAAVEPAVVIHRGVTDIVRSASAIRLSEGDLDDTYYLPLAAIPKGLLEPSSHDHYCRWKGDARFFNVRVGTELIANGAWSYPQAPEELAVIRDRVAFDAAHFTLALDLSTSAESASHTASEPA